MKLLRLGCLPFDKLKDERQRQTFCLNPIHPIKNRGYYEKHLRVVIIYASVGFVRVQWWRGRHW